jgi:hypothetical protein
MISASHSSVWRQCSANFAISASSSCSFISCRLLPFMRFATGQDRIEVPTGQGLRLKDERCCGAWRAPSQRVADYSTSQASRGRRSENARPGLTNPKRKAKFLSFRDTPKSRPADDWRAMVGVTSPTLSWNQFTIIDQGASSPSKKRRNRMAKEAEVLSSHPRL